MLCTIVRRRILQTCPRRLSSSGHSLQVVAPTLCEHLPFIINSEACAFFLRVTTTQCLVVGCLLHVFSVFSRQSCFVYLSAGIEVSPVQLVPVLF